MKRWFLTTDCVDPHANLALESAITDAAGDDEEYFFLWQNKQTVVIGRNQNAWRECRCELLESEGGVLARRPSGGGAVYHDLGNLNFTFVSAPDAYSLESNLSLITGALKRLGIAAEFTGRNDMTVGGAKFSGNAFKHQKNAVMHHGTLLISADMAMLSRYLRPDEAKLKAKGISSVRARVCNLNEFSPSLTVDMMADALKDAFFARGGAAALTESDFDRSEYLKTYSSWDWNYGETPKFDIELSARLSFGGIQLHMTQRHGLIESAAVYTDAMDENLAERLKHELIGRSYSAETFLSLPDKEIAAWLAHEMPV